MTVDQAGDVLFKHLPQFDARLGFQFHLHAGIDEEGIQRGAELVRGLTGEDRLHFLLHFSLPAVQLLQQLVGDLAAVLAVLAVHLAADRQQDIVVIEVNDIGLLADAEIDRPEFLVDLGVRQDVQQLGGLAAAAMTGEEELGRAEEGRQDGIRQLVDRVAGPVDVERIGLPVPAGRQGQVEFKIQPGPVKIFCFYVIVVGHCIRLLLRVSVCQLRSEQAV